MKTTCSLLRQPITRPAHFAELFARAAGIPLELGVIATLTEIAATAPIGSSELHGFRHWLTVLENGLAIIDATEELHSTAFRQTVILFALFHDIRRETEGPCSEHGKAGAMYLTKGLSREHAEWVVETFGKDVIKMAAFACELHTICEVPDQSPLMRHGESLSPLFGKLAKTERLVIGACLDADRLDLGRVGIRPDPYYLATPAAKDYATWRK